jgi:hypothetical protein
VAEVMTILSNATLMPYLIGISALLCQSALVWHCAIHLQLVANRAVLVVFQPQPRKSIMSTKTEAQQSVTDYMTGFGRVNQKGLQHLATYPDWKRVAYDELQLRANSFIRNLTDDDLIAISKGEVDIGQIAKEIISKT